MSNQMLARTLGFLEDAVIGDAKMINNNSSMALVKTIAQYTPRTSIKTALALTGGSVADVFTVTGYIEIQAFVVHVTTVCSANACTMAWSADPTVGAANTPIMAAIEMNACVLGSMVHAVAAAGAGVIVANDTTLGIFLPNSIVCPAGGIDMTLSTSDLTTGIATVIVVYRPLTADGFVAAA